MSSKHGTGWMLGELNPADIKNHPVNIEIYGTHPQDDDMLASVLEFGVLQPIKVTKDYTALSGHRRNQHARIAKLKSVPVLVARHALSEAEQVVEIVESNRQREKTVEQKAREYKRLAEAKEAIKSKIKESNLKRGNAESPERVKKPIRENPKENAKNGRAKDEAAEAVGMSRSTAEKAKEVVAEIDRLVAAGDLKEAETLRSKLNTETVAAAHREAVPPKPKAEDDAVLDHFKKPLPETLRDTFAAVSEFNRLRRLISDVKALAKEICELPSGEWLKRDIQELEDHANQIKRLVRFSTPHTECAKCRRKPSKTCAACKGTGWVTEAMMTSSFSEADKKWLESRV